MPTIAIDRNLLFHILGRTYTDEEFADLCFEFGIELDEVVIEREDSTEKLTGNEESSEEEKLAQTSCLDKETINQTNSQALTRKPLVDDKIVYKIEVPANRYDLLCLEGLSRALRIFLGIDKLPKYIRLPYDEQHGEILYVRKGVEHVRKYILAAILRDVHFTPTSYASFIDLQEKLHQTLCRKRTLASIGTHDYDTIKGPIIYEACLPSDISFVPLNQTSTFTAEQLMDYYKRDMKLKKYLPILEESTQFPVVRDSTGTVLSWPPIINSEHSKLKLTTKNIFIECTATDLTKAHVVLSIMVTMFSEYCTNQFTVEPVRIVHSNGQEELSPQLGEREMEVNADYIMNRVGVQLSSTQIGALLNRMSIEAVPVPDTRTLRIRIPPTRPDILHACDIMEDVAIGYGFNKIEPRIPRTNTIAQAFNLNKLSDLLRNEMAQAGFSEVLTLSLCSLQENFDYLNRPNNGEAVTIANPKTLEYQVARSSLLPGILKTINCNKKAPLPLRLFEISDIVLKDTSRDVQARNERRLCAVYYGMNSGFEVIHGLLDRFMEVLNVTFSHASDSHGYFIRPSDNPTFFPDRRADIYYNQIKIGSFGILHPDVIKSFDLCQSCSALEVTIEPFI